jgi:preprotein translocase subunit YajC
MKRQKEMQAMLGALKKGDEVTTGGGMVGRITALDDNFVTLEVAKSVELVFQRNSIHSILPTGTFKP